MNVPKARTGAPAESTALPATLVRTLRGFSHLPPVLLVDFEARQRRVLDALARVEDGGAAMVLYPHKALCNDRTCAIVEGEQPLYWDDDHPSVFGARRVMEVFTPMLEAWAAPQDR